MKTEQRRRLRAVIQQWLNKEYELDGIDFWQHPETASDLAKVLEAAINACERGNHMP